MIILDTNSLVRLLVPAREGSDDSLRLRGLLETTKAAGWTIGIPAPVFSEFLVRADDATTEMLDAFERRQGIKVLPFDKRAARERALLDRYALSAGNKKAGATDSWQKIKIDRQIVAIARVHSALEILTEDRDSLQLGSPGRNSRAFSC